MHPDSSWTANTRAQTTAVMDRIKQSSRAPVAEMLMSNIGEAAFTSWAWKAEYHYE
jgi:hypothetical protein